MAKRVSKRGVAKRGVAQRSVAKRGRAGKRAAGRARKGGEGELVSERAESGGAERGVAGRGRAGRAGRDGEGRPVSKRVKRAREKADRKLAAVRERGVQGVLPGCFTKKEQEIIDKTNAYVEARDARILLLADEVKLKGELLLTMKKARRETFKGDGVEVIVVHGKDKLMVKGKKDEKPVTVEVENGQAVEQ